MSAADSSSPPSASSPPLPFPLLNPYVAHQGFTLHRMAGGEAELQLQLQAQHLNSFEVAHGGVLMGLLDVAMAHAARSLHMDQPGMGPGVVTLEMKTSFMRPGEGRLRARAKVLNATPTLAFCEGRVEDDMGALCAHATATFKFVRALPSRDRRLKALQEAKPEQA